MDLNDLSDEELGRMIRRAKGSYDSMRSAQGRGLEGFCDFLEAVGLGQIAAAIRFSAYAYERIKSIWRRIFG